MKQSILPRFSRRFLTTMIRPGRPPRAVLVLSVMAGAAFGHGVIRAADAVPPFEAMLKIDAHSHLFEDAPEFQELHRRLNIRTINVCNRGTNPKFAEMHAIARELYRKHPELYPFECSFDLTRIEDADYPAQVIAFLGEQFRAGAIGVKIWKEIGLDIKGRDGAFILPDDPRFDPIYAFIARGKKVLHAHIAEPIDAWRPLDPNSPHYSYYSKNQEWHLHGKPGYPSHERLMLARDRILERNPDLVVVGAHLGSLEHDLDAIAASLDRHPNLYIETAARSRDLTFHSSDKVRALFLKYQDRILYGVDAIWRPFMTGPASPVRRQGHIAILESLYRSDYEYFAGRGAITFRGRKVEALALPQEVLDKLYRGNAIRIYRLEAAWSGRPAGR